MGSSTSNVTNVNDDGGLLSFSIQKPMYEDEITKDVTKGSESVFLVELY